MADDAQLSRTHKHHSTPQIIEHSKASKYSATPVARALLAHFSLKSGHPRIQKASQHDKNQVNTRMVLMQHAMKTTIELQINSEFYSALLCSQSWKRNREPPDKTINYILRSNARLFIH